MKALPLNMQLLHFLITDFNLGIMSLPSEIYKAYKEQITGTVELDESFYGGTFKNLRKKVKAEYRRLGLNKREGGAKYRKQPIFGIFKRNGKVYLELIPEAKAKVLMPIIKNRIKLGSDVHINGMEGFWGLSKTNMHTYKGIKKKNWALYIKEMQWRYNTRALCLLLNK